MLDRVQSVSVAARGQGINVQTAFPPYKTGAVTRKPRKASGPSQRTSQAEKAEFLTVLERAGSVSTAARELGLDQRMCIGWARRAGIASVHPGVRKREEFLRLRRAASAGRKRQRLRARAARVRICGKTALSRSTGAPFVSIQTIPHINGR